MAESVLALLSARKGHFLLESGHHGDFWLDLEALCYQPQRLRAMAGELAKAIFRLGCGCGLRASD
jgi:orotate phosphoribosyltransferase